MGVPPGLMLLACTKRRVTYLTKKGLVEETRTRKLSIINYANIIRENHHMAGSVAGWFRVLVL